MIVCLDGIDQAGKNTQCRILTEKIRAVQFDSPDDRTFEGQIVREYLSHKWAPITVGERSSTDYRPYVHSGAVVQCAYATEKLMKQPLIQAAAESGHAVLNRWMESAFSYSLADGTSEGWLVRLMKSMLRPDLSVLLNIPPAESVRRKTEGRDLYEAKPGEFRERLVANYLRLWRDVGPREFPQTQWVIVDGLGSVDDVARRIEDAVVGALRGLCGTGERPQNPALLAQLTQKWAAR